jgi:TPR repeat protein
MNFQMLSLLPFLTLSAAFAAGTSSTDRANFENRMGEKYQFGEGVPRDYASALRWYRKASAHGHATAPNHIGRMYLNGEGVARNRKTACDWYRISSERGDAAGVFNNHWCNEHTRS